MRPRTRTLLELPRSPLALEAELVRLERELEHAPPGRRRRILSMERRRAIIRRDAIRRGLAVS